MHQCGQGVLGRPLVWSRLHVRRVHGTREAGRAGNCVRRGSVRGSAVHQYGHAAAASASPLIARPLMCRAEVSWAIAGTRGRGGQQPSDPRPPSPPPPGHRSAVTPSTAPPTPRASHFLKILLRGTKHQSSRPMKLREGQEGGEGEGSLGVERWREGGRDERGEMLGRVRLEKSKVCVCD